MTKIDFPYLIIYVLPGIVLLAIITMIIPIDIEYLGEFGNVIWFSVILCFALIVSHSMHIIGHEIERLIDKLFRYENPLILLFKNNSFGVESWKTATEEYNFNPSDYSIINVNKVYDCIKTEVYHQNSLKNLFFYSALAQLFVSLMAVLLFFIVVMLVTILIPASFREDINLLTKILTILFSIGLFLYLRKSSQALWSLWFKETINSYFVITNKKKL